MKPRQITSKWKTLHPVLEKRFIEQNTLYVYGDADDTTLRLTTTGQYQMDLKKWGWGVGVASVILFMLLRRR